MSSVSFTVHGVPQPAGSKKGFYNAKARRVIITDDAKKSRPWKALVADAAAQAMTYTSEDLGGEGTCGYLPPLEGPLLLELTFWMPRPKSHYGAKGLKPSAPRFPTVRPDCLKLARSVEDALSGLVYSDDAQIATEILQKTYGEPARCEILVAQIEQATLDTTRRQETLVA